MKIILLSKQDIPHNNTVRWGVVRGRKIVQKFMFYRRAAEYMKMNGG